jgi:hypothetical protein
MKDWRAWQAKHGSTPAAPTAGPPEEIREGEDGILREYCGRCRWGWPVGTRTASQMHQRGCPNSPSRGK